MIRISRRHVDCGWSPQNNNENETQPSAVMPSCLCCVLQGGGPRTVTRQVLAACFRVKTRRQGLFCSCHHVQSEESAPARGMTLCCCGAAPILFFWVTGKLRVCTTSNIKILVHVQNSLIKYGYKNGNACAFHCTCTCKKAKITVLHTYVYND